MDLHVRLNVAWIMARRLLEHFLTPRLLPARKTSTKSKVRQKSIIRKQVSCIFKGLVGLRYHFSPHLALTMKVKTLHYGTSIGSISSF